MNNFDLTSFLFFAMALSLLMLGNAASGAMKARKEGKFSWDELRDGCINYLLWLGTVLCLVAATQIYGGNFVITIGDNSYTLFEAIEIAKRTVYVIWAGKLIQNIYEYTGITRQINLEKSLEKISNSSQGEQIQEGGIG